MEGLLANIPPEVDIVALSGTSGGALCAALAWDGLVRGEPLRAIAKLEAFWGSVAATKPLDRMVNSSLMHIMSLRNQMVLPEVSPYQLPPWGEDDFRRTISSHFDFPELRKLARRPGGPHLCIGAVEVLSGHFEIFTGEDLCVECLMASAAIPELFRAVTVPGKGVYWDGLFSHNPPIFELTEHDVNEIWVIQINPSTCTNVPTETHEILDRRNALAGNLSMERELALVEINNRAIAEGRLSSQIQADSFGTRRVRPAPRLSVEARSSARVFVRATGVRKDEVTVVSPGTGIEEIRHGGARHDRVEHGVIRLRPAMNCGARRY